LVAWLCGITLDRGPNLPSPIALIYAGAATLTPLGLGDQECQKSKKSCFLRALPMVQFYDALKANGLLVASGKKKRSKNQNEALLAMCH